MQVAYSGTDGTVPPLCVRARPRSCTAPSSCQSLGGGRLEQAVAAAFLEAVTPGRRRRDRRRVARARNDQHDARLAGQRLALERAAVRGRPRAPPVRRLRARAPARRAHPRSARSRTRSAARRARARQARRARARRARRRSPTTRRAALARARARPAAVLERADDHRPRPQGAAARARQRGRRHRPPRRPARADVEIVLGGRRAHRAQRARSTPRRHDAPHRPRTRSS